MEARNYNIWIRSCMTDFHETCSGERIYRVPGSVWGERCTTPSPIPGTPTQHQSAPPISRHTSPRLALLPLQPIYDHCPTFITQLQYPTQSSHGNLKRYRQRHRCQRHPLPLVLHRLQGVGECHRTIQGVAPISPSSDRVQAIPLGSET